MQISPTTLKGKLIAFSPTTIANQKRHRGLHLYEKFFTFETIYTELCFQRTKHCLILATSEFMMQQELNLISIYFGALLNLARLISFVSDNSINSCLKQKIEQ